MSDLIDHDLIDRLKSGDCTIENNDDAAEHIGILGDELERLTARIKVLEDVLDKLARLGNEPHYGNSDGNVIAQKAIAAADKCDHTWVTRSFTPTHCSRCGVVASETGTSQTIAAADKEDES